LTGCIIKGKVADQNGAGVPGVTVTLNGAASMTTTTDTGGNYQFGTVDNILSAGTYTIIPSGEVTPETRTVSLTTQTLGELGDVPFPAFGVDFIAGGQADYSGIYYVNLSSQPRWMMAISHSGKNVTFSLDGIFLIEGEGTVTDNTMTLTSEINGTVNISITFSGDGQSFSGTWNYFGSNGTITSNGSITGTKNPWVTYDVDINGIPQFVSTDVIELSKISEISKFRSGEGHDYSDDFESCRSMKTYFLPKTDVDKLSIKIFSPINGTVIGTTDEWTEESVSKGEMISIESEEYPAFHLIIFHIDLIKPLNVGDKIVAGQLLGHPAGYENSTIADTAVGVITPKGYKLVSYFEVITDALFQSYQARGLNARDDVIISKEERDADPLTCIDEIFTNGGNLDNWVILN